MRRGAALVAGLLLLTTATSAQAEKLPFDEGLAVALTPATSTVRVGQTLDLALAYTDDDAVTVEASLEVQGGEGSVMVGDGACASPLQRSRTEGRVLLRARFAKPGRYVVRGRVSTFACHGQLTGAGDERVRVARTIRVVR